LKFAEKVEGVKLVKKKGAVDEGKTTKLFVFIPNPSVLTLLFLKHRTLLGGGHSL